MLPYRQCWCRTKIEMTSSAQPKLASSLWIISYSRKSSKLGRLLRFHSIDDSTNEFQISFGNTLPMTRVIDDESGIHFQCAKDIEGHDKTIDIWPLTCPTRTFPPAKLMVYTEYFFGSKWATYVADKCIICTFLSNFKHCALCCFSIQYQFFIFQEKLLIETDFCCSIYNCNSLHAAIHDIGPTAFWWLIYFDKMSWQKI